MKVSEQNEISWLLNPDWQDAYFEIHETNDAVFELRDCSFGPEGVGYRISIEIYDKEGNELAWAGRYETVSKVFERLPPTTFDLVSYIVVLERTTGFVNRRFVTVFKFQGKNR